MADACALVARAAVRLSAPFQANPGLLQLPPSRPPLPSPQPPPPPPSSMMMMFFINLWDYTLGMA